MKKSFICAIVCIHGRSGVQLPDAGAQQSDIMRQLLDSVREGEPSERGVSDGEERARIWTPERVATWLDAAEPEGAEAFQQLLSAASENAAALEAFPTAELDGIVTALAGGFIAPSSGADVLRNPQAAPTGRNLYSINAELVARHGAGCSYETCGNAKLHEVEGMQLEERRTIAETLLSETSPLATALLASLIVAATAILVLTGLLRPTPLAA
jgi:hypothetical protein